MVRRKKMIAIIMTLVAIASVATNEVAKAMNKVNGIPGPISYWSGNECIQCELEDPGQEMVCTPEGDEPCLCTTEEGSAPARDYTGLDPNQESNCVQLFKTPAN